MYTIRQMVRCSTLMFADYFMSCNEAMTRLFVSRNGVTYEVKLLPNCNTGIPYAIRCLSNHPVYSDWKGFLSDMKEDCRCFLKAV